VVVTEKNISGRVPVKKLLLLFFPVVQRHKFLLFLLGCCRETSMGEEDDERLTVAVFQMTERETIKRVRLLFFSVISSPFLYLLSSSSFLPLFFLFFCLSISISLSAYVLSSSSSLSIFFPSSVFSINSLLFFFLFLLFYHSLPPDIYIRGRGERATLPCPITPNR
jgi:hypothetical protein